MNKYEEALENLLSFAFVMSENMVGLTKGNYDEKEFVKKTDEYLRNYIKNFECRDILKQALNELQAIKKSNPNEALEAIYRIIAHTEYDNDSSYDCLKFENDCKLIEQYILKAQEQEKEKARAFGKDIINLNKTLKQTIDEPILYVSRYGNKYIVPQELFDEQCNVLSIIKEKDVDIDMIKDNQTVIEYNWNIRFEKYKRKELTPEEFDTLKRWVEND